MRRLGFIVFSHAFFWIKNGGRVMCLLTVMGATVVSTVQAQKAWYPVEVDVWRPPFNDQRLREQKLYTPLKKAQKRWRIRVFIPHLKVVDRDSIRSWDTSTTLAPRGFRPIFSIND